MLNALDRIKDREGMRYERKEKKSPRKKRERREDVIRRCLPPLLLLLLSHCARSVTGDAISSSFVPRLDATKGFLPGLVKLLQPLGRQEGNMVVTLLEQLLRVVIDDKLGSVHVRLEPELFGDEPQPDVGFVPALLERDASGTGRRTGGDWADSRFTNVAQRHKTFPRRKHVHQVGAHVRCCQVELEEAVVVAQRQRRPHLQGVANGLRLLLCCG